MAGRRKHADWLKKLKAERGESVEEPEQHLPEHLLWIWEAFAALSRTRENNQTGPQPITFGEVAAYCALNSISSHDDIDDLLFFITELDIVWLKKTHAKIEVEMEKAKRKNTRR